MWSANRGMYYGAQIPDGFERALLEAHARLHWLRTETMQNIRAIAAKDEKAANAI